MLRRHEKEALLRRLGFTYVRHGRHGYLWRNASGITVQIQRGSARDVHAEKNWLARLRKALGYCPLKETARG